VSPRCPLRGRGLDVEVCIKVDLDRLPVGHGDDPDAVDVLGVVLWVVGRGDVARGVVVAQHDVPATRYARHRRPPPPPDTGGDTTESQGTTQTPTASEFIHLTF